MNSQEEFTKLLDKAEARLLELRQKLLAAGLSLEGNENVPPEIIKETEEILNEIQTASGKYYGPEFEAEWRKTGVIPSWMMRGGNTLN